MGGGMSYRQFSRGSSDACERPATSAWHPMRAPPPGAVLLSGAVGTPDAQLPGVRREAPDSGSIADSTLAVVLLHSAVLMRCGAPAVNEYLRRQD